MSKGAALKFVVLIGITSLFADMTYEGARSIIGPYLMLLGASGTMVGIVAGSGELIGYSLRLASGYISDRTGRYWAVTILGYIVNMLAVPLLALAVDLRIAIALVITERIGKAIRTPARDAMLSHAGQQLGSGWVFGLHEALDQAGAVAGPLIVAGVLYVGGGYQAGFASLLMPALLCLSAVAAARLLYPHPQHLEVAPPELQSKGLPRSFWLYLAATGLIAAGYADFTLIAYHFQQAATVPATWVPLLYALAMGVDALAAILFGRLFDRAGLIVLAGAASLSALFAPLVFWGDFTGALLGMLLWGIGMGAQESIMRAAVAGMAPPNRRGTAYGIFNTGFGLCWFAGSALMGLLYDLSLPALILFSVLIQLAAIPLLIWVKRI
jgi:MFS family permease